MYALVIRRCKKLCFCFVVTVSIMRIHTCVCKDFSYVINDFILYYWLFAFQIHYNCGKYLLVGIYQHFVEGLMLKLKLQYIGHLMQRVN